MREHLHALACFRHLHRIEHSYRLFKSRGFAQPFMQHQNFHQLLADPHIRVQRRHRVLENHRNLFGTQLIQIALGQIKDFATVKSGGTANMAIRGQKPH